LYQAQRFNQHHGCDQTPNRGHYQGTVTPAGVTEKLVCEAEY